VNEVVLTLSLPIPVDLGSFYLEFVLLSLEMDSRFFLFLFFAAMVGFVFRVSKWYPDAYAGEDDDAK